MDLPGARLILGGSSALSPSTGAGVLFRSGLRFSLPQAPPSGDRATTRLAVSALRLCVHHYRPLAAPDPRPRPPPGDRKPEAVRAAFAAPRRRSGFRLDPGDAVIVFVDIGLPPIDTRPFPASYLTGRGPRLRQPQSRLAGNLDVPFGSLHAQDLARHR